MYTQTTIGQKSTRFGLWAGQFSAKCLLADSAWFNKQGDLLGSGDITAKNIVRIQSELEDGEVFVLLPAHGWVEREKLTNPFSPGIDYICSRAVYAITPGLTYAINRKGVYGKGDVGGLAVEYIGEASLRRLLS